MLTLSCSQAGLDPLHTVDLGIWVHMLTAIAYKIDETLEYGSILGRGRIEDVWKRLCDNAEHINEQDSLIKVNRFKALYLKTLLDQRKHVQSGSKMKKPQSRKLEAWEHHILMLVSCVLRHGANTLFCSV